MKIKEMRQSVESTWWIKSLPHFYVNLLFTNLQYSHMHRIMFSYFFFAWNIAGQMWESTQRALLHYWALAEVPKRVPSTSQTSHGFNKPSQPAAMGQPRQCREGRTGAGQNLASPRRAKRSARCPMQTCDELNSTSINPPHPYSQCAWIW